MALLSDLRVCLLWSTWSGVRILKTFMSGNHTMAGIGTKLIIEVAAICEQMCAGKGLYLSVNQANQNAQKFYLKLGAENAQVSVWDAPDGSHVPTFRFVWKTTAAFASQGN
jgi:GNAT superfamily N-acetyltransferase